MAKTVDLRTSQNVTISYTLAGTMDRVVAFVVDALLVSVAYWFVATLLQGLFVVVGESGEMTIALFYLFFLLGYFFLSEVFGNGQTIGKRMMNVRVVRLDTRTPTVSDYLLRTIFYLVDAIFSIGLLGILLIAGTPRRQRLGDLAANTTVIKLRSDSRFSLDNILNIKSLDDYEVTYPQVTALSESDMLVVKTALGRYTKHQNPAHAKALRLLVERLCDRLDIPQPALGQLAFLRKLLEDYIVLTR